MYRVFVFPTSNEPGLEIINALSKSNKVSLFGGSSGDTSHDPARLLLSDFEEIPWHDAPDFESRFSGILRRLQIDVLFPAWDKLIAQFAQWKECPCRVVAPNSETALLLLSKSSVYNLLQGTIPTPKIYMENESVRFPVFAKPDQGSGSKDIYLIENTGDLAMASQKGLLICEYLPGPEYTVDCFNDMDGKLLLANVRLRGKIGRGIALGTQIINSDDIHNLCEIISKFIKIEGPWFAQFKENSDGVPVLLEVNARIAGSMGLTRYAGANIPLMSVFQCMGHKIQVPKLKHNLLVNRCLNILPEPDSYTCVIWDLDDTLIGKNGKPAPDAIAHLFDCKNRGKKQLLLTKNPNANQILNNLQIPNFFDCIQIEESHKIAALPALLLRHNLSASECVMVNDSYQELFEAEAIVPGIRVIMPDVLARLGREKFS